MTRNKKDSKPGSNKIIACIMDMDGVVTDTARLHAKAWKKMFDEFLEGRQSRKAEDLKPFDIEQDYLQYVDGKPRYDGVRSFLKSRGITIDYGDPDDSAEKVTVCGLGNRKNEYFLEILGSEKVKPYPDSINFIKRGREAGIRFALISASRNAGKVLEAAELTDLFEVVVDGITSAELGLKGKPQPDIFLTAADRLEVEVEKSAVIEDSRAGVEAGRNGGFAMVVGMARSNRREKDLLRAGADLVVHDLEQLSFGPEGMKRRLESALDRVKTIVRKMRRGVPAILLDYDGTLTPIVDDPGRADLDDDMRRTVASIGEHWFTAVISGRGLEDIRRRVGIDNLIYAGSHGFEATGGSGYFDQNPEKEKFLDLLESAESELRDFTADMDGVIIERKKFAIAVHFRQADPENVPSLEQKVDELARDSAELKKTGGKKIFELRPDVDWDKGRVLDSMLERFHIDCSRVVPLYIGDDETDEDAFRAVNERNGIAVLVGDPEKRTAASYVLRDPAEVADFLKNIAEQVYRDEGGAAFSLVYEGFEPKEEKLREALCTLGNGYFASRGAAPEAEADSVHYPGTYIAGCYNRRWSEVENTVIENESMVNVPNWLPLAFRLENGEWFDLREAEPAQYHQELDMKSGMLIRKFRFSDDGGREISVQERRLVSMDFPHLAGLQIEITVSDWSGTMQVLSAIDGRVTNSLVKRYRPLNNDHLEQIKTGSDEEGRIIWLKSETNQSHVRIAEACRTRIYQDGRELEPECRIIEEPGYIGQELTLQVHDSQTVRVEKILALYNSRDRATTECLLEARQTAAGAPDFDGLLENHRRAWTHLWRRCSLDIRMPGQRISQILNLHIFHLLQTVSVHSIDLDVGVPPRGLHGEAYRGLIMWDELFVFPFLNHRIPDITRALLMYRYRRLPMARKMARDAGLAGAMFPWQSGSNGREEAQTLHLNPQSGHWIPDDSQLQRHINIAVAYNVWIYYQVSGDLDFITFYGAELIVETARFWAGLASHNEKTGRYEIKGIMGPDEFHTGYPWNDEPGLDNNAYTNIMAVWILCRALDVLEIIPADRRRSLWENLSLQEEDLELWEEISRKMYLEFHDDGIISQFQGYDRLKEFDWEKYKKKYGNIHRLDRILEAEDDSPNNYKLSKQADVLMLFYLLSADELREIFDRLGYAFEYETIPKNIDYYLKRTSHGSTLSRVVHAWVLARSRRKQSWNLFCDALKSDVVDIQGGTTHEGIHLGAMAGTIDLIQRCYTGLETRKDTLRFNPALPEEVRELSFSILYRNHWLQVIITDKSLTVDSQRGNHGAITVEVDNNTRELEPGGTVEFSLNRKKQGGQDDDHKVSLEETAVNAADE